ncbi:MAG: LysR family transcriptional regulator [Gammaproteobacteria bacterium]|nr:LysR family transcriptional regulator [Gammaproteobacteria bacterium]
MAKRWQLPPLQSLTFFEAAARHLSFTAAARELHTTQPAISHHILRLEQDLGSALFKRQHRSVTLTEAGAQLHEAVSTSLSTLHLVAGEIRSRRKAMTVSTDFAFAAYWLLPRMAMLRKLAPDLDVRIVASQYYCDIRQEPADVAVVFGTGHWPDRIATLLIPEIVIPVCSPSFRTGQRLSGDPGDLVGVPLLHLERSDPASWLSWKDWFDLHRITVSQTEHDFTINSYPLVIQAAIGGQGVALGWLPLVEEALRNKQLVTAARQPVKTKRGYFLVESTAATKPVYMERFRRWIIDECHESMAQHSTMLGNLSSDSSARSSTSHRKQLV